MTKDDMRERLTAFAVRIIKMVDNLPATIAGNAIARQIVRSGTSPSANYRAACLAKSDKDFVNIIVKTITSTEARMKADGDGK